MIEIHLKQLVFTYDACRAGSKNKEKMQKFKEKVDSRYTYQNKLDKALFQLDVAYGAYKDLTRRTASNKVLHGKTFEIYSYHKYSRYQRRPSSIVYKAFDEKLKGSDTAIKS